MKGDIEMVKMEWSHLALGVGMLVCTPLCVFIWLSNKMGMRRAFALFVFWFFVFVWNAYGAVLIVRGLKKG